MAELQSRADHLQQENDRLRAPLEEDRVENKRGSSHPAPPVKKNKGKEPIRPDDNDAAADDELSSGSSALLDFPPPKNNVEAESRKRPPRHSSISVSGIPRRVRREFSKESRQSEQALENIPTWKMSVTPSLPFVYPTFGAAPAPYMPTPITIRGVEDMLSSPLGLHILSYEPPHGFVIPSFTMNDGSFDPYDHMLHYNHAMILNVGEDSLLCKLFSASLKGPALAWFHKLHRRSINSFSELWATFVSQYLCLVRQKRNISSIQTIFKGEDESICDFTRRFGGGGGGGGGGLQQIDSYSMDAVHQNFRRRFGVTTPFFYS